MDKKEALETIQEIRKNSKKRNFNQTFDLIMNFTGLDLKKPEHNINTFLRLPYSKGRQNRVGIFIGKELLNKAKGVCDEVIQEKDLAILAKDKKKLKKFAKNVDFFIAQADIMPKIAMTLGKILGPMGKMPNPKAGCIVQPTIPDLKPVCTALANTVRIQTKNEPCVKIPVGKEDSKDEEIAENIMAVYNSVLHLLPQEKHSIKNIFIKLTMGKSFLVGKEEVKAAAVITRKQAKAATLEKKKNIVKKETKPAIIQIPEEKKKIVKKSTGKKENGTKV